MMSKIRVHSPEMPPTLVPYGSELALPATFTITVEGADYALALDVAANGEGPRITSLTVSQVEGGDPVTTDGVRSLALGRLLRQGVELATWAPLRDAEGQIVGGGVNSSTGAFEAAEREVAGSRRRWLLTDEHLAQVARVYLANPRNEVGVRAPTIAVMDHFDVSRPTAGRWVVEARKRGLLAPADQRGGKLPTKRAGRKR